MADSYSFIQSEQVTVLIPPFGSVEEQQVTAQAIKSGTVFLSRFDMVTYGNPSEVAQILGALADRFDTWATVPGVQDIATLQDFNAQNQLSDGTEVTVQSSSGKSTTTFRWVYPVAEFNTVAPFAAKVKQVVSMLNAVEGE